MRTPHRNFWISLRRWQTFSAMPDCLVSHSLHALLQTTLGQGEELILLFHFILLLYITFMIVNIVVLQRRQKIFLYITMVKTLYILILQYWLRCAPFRLIHKRFKKTFINARGGGVTEATKRLLGQLPISAQSFSASPYLDLTLFSYDDKWVSVMERPKSCADHPIRWLTNSTWDMYTYKRQL